MTRIFECLAALVTITFIMYGIIWLGKFSMALGVIAGVIFCIALMVVTAEVAAERINSYFKYGQDN